MVLQSPEKEPSLWVEVDFRVYLEAHTLPLFLGYLVLWLGSIILKSRRPKKGVGYEPPGRGSGFNLPELLDFGHVCGCICSSRLESRPLPEDSKYMNRTKFGV